MSRDWTPIESYYFDKKHREQTGIHFYEMNLTWHMLDSNEVFEDEKSKKLQEIAKNYEYLVITNPDGVIELVEKISEKTLKDINTKIKLLCDCFDAQKDIGSENVEQFIKEWMIGKLDSGFYYREYNDELFLEELMQLDSN